jgi:S1-C subfamily serine protease
MQENKPSQSEDFSPQPELTSSPTGRKTMFQTLHNFLRRFYLLAFFVLVIIAGFISVFIFNLTQPPPQHLTQEDINRAVVQALASVPPSPSFESQVYQIVRPSIVTVNISILKPDGESESDLGSGVVVDDGGTILTCLHVVKDATDIKVEFVDGTESEASIIATQPENDLAVLQPQVIPDNLIPATLASASMLQVGDQVVAIGNPFGITGSLSSGVVSGLGRIFKSAETGEILTNLIQFDAAVNPGNSGGPLINRTGEVVGIVTSLLNPTEQSVFIGIGFAVPIETAASALGPPWW